MVQESSQTGLEIYMDEKETQTVRIHSSSGGTQTIVRNMNQYVQTVVAQEAVAC